MTTYATQDFKFTITVAEDPGAAIIETVKLKKLDDLFITLKIKHRVKFMNTAFEMFAEPSWNKATYTFGTVTYSIEKL